MKNALFSQMKFKLNNRKGMTLVEVLVSITLASIVMVIIMGVLMYQGLMTRNIQQTSILSQEAAIASTVMREWSAKSTEVLLYADASAFTPSTKNYFIIDGDTLSHFVYDTGSFTETVLTNKLANTPPSFFATPFSNYSVHATVALEKADLGIVYTTLVSLSYDNLVFANTPVTKDDTSVTEFYVLEYEITAP